MGETFNPDGSSQFLPTMAVHQVDKYLFQGHTVQWIIGLKRIHAITREMTIISIRMNLMSPGKTTFDKVK